MNSYSIRNGAHIAALSAALAGAAHAQTVNWTVVGGQNAVVPMAPMQAAGDRAIESAGWTDGGSRWGFWTSQAPDAGWWTRQPNGMLQRFMALGVTGTTGPGRVGAESGHTFAQRFDDAYDGGIDGKRAFLARAGTANAYTDGVWLWDGVRNIEIARSTANAGTLGPGAGADWSFAAGDRYSLLRVGVNGEVMIDSHVRHIGGATSDVVTKYAPGAGNRACAMARSTDPLLGPNLTAGDTFSYWNGAASRSVDASGRMFGWFATEGFRSGLWELCNGVPRALAVDGETGARGPGIAPAPDAKFGVFNTGAVLGAPGLASFAATVYLTPQAGAPTNGIFRNNGATNRPLALAGDTGDFSPRWNGATFSSFVWESLDAAGRYVTFSAFVNTASGSRVGLWRAGSGAGPQPVAILGDTGAYSPGGGLTWTDLYERTIFAGGDIALIARTSDGQVALWLLSEGRAPERLLATGQAIGVPTASGTAQAAIATIATSGGAIAARSGSGNDTWAGADGSVLLRVTTTPSYDTLWIAAKARDRIFQDGFND